jgi:hypothetical protein
LMVPAPSPQPSPAPPRHSSRRYNCKDQK